MGVQEAEPLIRNKAIGIQEEQIRKQALGFLTSLAAVEMEERGLDMPVRKNFREIISSIFNNTERLGKDDNDFMDEVIRKRVRYHRAMTKMDQAREKRSELGFPVGKGSAKRIH